MFRTKFQFKRTKKLHKSISYSNFYKEPFFGSDFFHVSGKKTFGLVKSGIRKKRFCEHITHIKANTRGNNMGYRRKNK